MSSRHLHASRFLSLLGFAVVVACLAASAPGKRAAALPAPELMPPPYPACELEPDPQPPCDNCFATEICNCMPGEVLIPMDEGGKLCFVCPAPGTTIGSLEGFCAIATVCCPDEDCYPSTSEMCSEALVWCRCDQIQDTENCDWNNSGGVDCEDLEAFLADDPACPFSREQQLELACCFIGACRDEFMFDPNDEKTECEEFIDCLEEIVGHLTQGDLEMLFELGCFAVFPVEERCDALCLVTERGTRFWWVPDESDPDKMECDYDDSGAVDCEDFKTFVELSRDNCNGGEEFTDSEILDLLCVFLGECGVDWDITPEPSLCESVKSCLEDPDLLGPMLTACHLNAVAGCLPDGFSCPACCDTSGPVFYLECDQEFQCDRDCDGEMSCDDLALFVAQAEKCHGALSVDDIVELICLYLTECDTLPLCVGLDECVSSILLWHGHSPGDLTPAQRTEISDCADCPPPCEDEEEQPTDREGPGLGCGGCSGPDNESNPLTLHGIDISHGDKILDCGDDVVVKVNGRDFRVHRSYTSNPDYSARCEGGNNWAMSPLYHVVEDQSCLYLYLGARGRICVPIDTESSSWPVPGPTSQYVERASIQSGAFLIPVWRLVEPGQWEMDFLRVNTASETGPPWVPVASPPLSGLVGEILETRDEHGNTHEYCTPRRNVGTNGL